MLFKKLRSASSAVPHISKNPSILTTESLVQLDFPDLIASWVQRILHVDLRRIIGVGAELHAAVLPVKWEICDLEGEPSRDVGRRRGGAGLERCLHVCWCSPWLHKSCSRVQEGSRLPCQYYKPARGHARPHQTPRHYCKQRWNREPICINNLPLEQHFSFLISVSKVETERTKSEVSGESLYTDPRLADLRANLRPHRHTRPPHCRWTPCWSSHLAATISEVLPAQRLTFNVASCTSHTEKSVCAFFWICVPFSCAWALGMCHFTACIKRAPQSSVKWEWN